MRCWMLPFLFTLLVACDDAGDVDARPDDDTGPSDETSETPDWSGSWQVTIEYDYTCDTGFGNMKDNSGNQSWNLSFSGDASDLTVTVNGNNTYTLTGTGDADGVHLCGPFPMPDLGNDPAPGGSSNAICIDADDVLNDEEVEGSATGSFRDDIGNDCELNDSPLVLTRGG